ncbi:GNAT family N-acetyltransferase [Segetibacter sp. 3557_3]|uniref:GNAT family N-acetyltransferase n=1 Tax=Segetibacter sp. 3557_3 TaxID=2547429 RepID=UPI001A9FFA49|nr:GNAT family N-acetyltransferase [Segetibacter sp. 3557_3]
MFVTERLVLRSVIPEDLESVYKGLSHPEVIRYYGVSYDSMESARDQMKFYDDLESQHTGKWFAICSSNEAKFYGACGLNNLNRQHKKAELGFWLLPQYWHQGIISEALPEIIRYGFNELDLHRLEAFVEVGNGNSKKALTKQGFNLEGTMIDCELKGDRFISLEIYARLNPANGPLTERKS